MNKRLFVGLGILILLCFFMNFSNSQFNFKNYNKNTENYLTILLNNTTKLLNDNKIDYWLDFGTCLGAFRDNDFIHHDTDIDITIFDDDNSKLKKIVNNKELLNNINLKVIRLNKDLISLKLIKFNNRSTDNNVRANPNDDPYIDIYIVKYKPYFDEIKFKGKKHNIPIKTNEYLEYIYGKTWNVPIKDKHANFDKIKNELKFTDYFKKNINLSK